MSTTLTAVIIAGQRHRKRSNVGDAQFISGNAQGGNDVRFQAETATTGSKILVRVSLDHSGASIILTSRLSVFTPSRTQHLGIRQHT
jgi:hypothetical protein